MVSYLVVGLQYYHAVSIFLTLSGTPSQRMTDYEIALARFVAEVCLRVWLFCLNADIQK